MHEMSSTRRLNPSQRGAIAEAAVAAATIELGFTVLRPLCEGRRYDLVVDLEPKLLRVQCKLAHRRGDVLVVNARTNRYTPQGYVSTAYTPEEIDAVATYAPELRCCHVIPARELAGRTSVYLRLDATRNNQAERINWAADYELRHVFEQIAAASGATHRSSATKRRVESSCLGL